MPMHKPRENPVLYYKPGDKKAFSAIFGHFYTPLRYFANRLLENEANAEDLVSDIFTKLWDKGGEFEDFSKIKAWLYITTRNACFNFLRKNDRLGLTSELFDEWKDEHTVLNSIIKAEAVRQIQALIEELPPECRKIIRMGFFGGLSNREIAEKLQLSVHTVKNQRARGILLLRTKFFRNELLWVLPLFNFFSD